MTTREIKSRKMFHCSFRFSVVRIIRPWPFLANVHAPARHESHMGRKYIQWP